MGFSRAVKIYQSIDYDYERSFGKADSSHAMRSFVFDQAVLDFWKDHPEGTVVNLGEGLETQRFRLTDHRPKDTVWLSVDLPEAIEAREKFITADQSNIHVPVSALDVESWAKKVPADKAVFITAQGILMYLEPDNVKSLFQDIAKTFPGATLMFDMISKFFSDMAMKGWKKTEHYTVPQLPFGVNKFDAGPWAYTPLAHRLEVSGACTHAHSNHSGIPAGLSLASPISCCSSQLMLGGRAWAPKPHAHRTALSHTLSCISSQSLSLSVRHYSIVSL